MVSPYKGPLTWARLCPVDRTDQVSGISPYLEILCKSFDVFIWEGGLEILAYEHFSPVTGMKAWWILASWMASSRIACNIFHFISIPFNCSDTALKVAKAMIVLLFIMFASSLQFRARTSSQDFWPFSPRKPGWNFWYEYKAKSVPASGPARSTELLWRSPESTIVHPSYIPPPYLKKTDTRTSACSLLHSRF